MNQKDNQGALFLNDKREKESQPNLKGRATIKGVQYYVSAWNNTSKDGIKYISLSFQEVETQNSPTNSIQDPKSNDLDFLNEIS